MPHDHANKLCTYHSATPEVVNQAIEDALAAKPQWENMPWADRAAIFLKAADLVAGKYRYELLAATMLGQGKNIWQAEIDAAAEVSQLRTGLWLETQECSSPTFSASASSTSSSCTSSSHRSTTPACGTAPSSDLWRASCSP